MQIFISYRRTDDPATVGRLRDRLRAVYGRGAVFRDIDGIGPGSRFADVIDDALTRADVVLVVIGPHWVDMRDDQGQRRLDQPDDWVRNEVQRALERDDVVVVPVLIGDTPLPTAADLPGDLHGLLAYEALRLSDRTFDHDVDRLVAALGPATLRERILRNLVPLAGALAIVMALGVAGFVASSSGHGPSPVVDAVDPGSTVLEGSQASQPLPELDPDQKQAGASSPPVGSSQGETCLNEELGYRLTVPSGLWAGDPEGEWGSCAAFDVDPPAAWPERTWGPAVVVTTVPRDVWRRSGAEDVDPVGGQPAERLGPVTATGAEPSDDFTRLVVGVDRGRVFLIASLLVSDAAELAGLQDAFDELVGSLELLPQGRCLSSRSPVCGAFHWTQDPEPNQPMTVDVDHAETVVVDEPFEVTIEASDPDADTFDVSVARCALAYSDPDPPWERAHYGRHGAYGAWQPPPPSGGSIRTTRTLTFEFPGEECFRVVVASSASTAFGPDPYVNYHSEDKRVTVVSPVEASSP